MGYEQDVNDNQETSRNINEQYNSSNSSTNSI
jgi:hypothetical protein